MALALYTFGMFAAPAEDPANDGFRELNDPLFELVDQAEGLIARSGYASCGTNTYTIIVLHLQHSIPSKRLMRLELQPSSTGHASELRANGA